MRMYRGAREREFGLQETAGATLKVFRHVHLPTLLKHHARRWLMGVTLPSREETRERE